MGNWPRANLVYGVKEGELKNRPWTTPPEDPDDDWEDDEDLQGAFENWWNESHEGRCPVNFEMNGSWEQIEYVLCVNDDRFNLSGSWDDITDATEWVEEIIGCPVEESQVVEEFKACLRELGVTAEPRWYLTVFYG